MGIRQKLNNNPALAIGLAIIVIIAAVLVSIRTVGSDDDGGRDRTNGVPKQYFTTDEGPNPQLFADEATKIPPFDHNGKPAYRARVYRCPHGKQFVANLERYSDFDRKRLQDAIDRAKTTTGHAPVDNLFNQIEVKKPGEKDWVKLNATTRDRYEAIMKPVCPEGSEEGVTPVVPE